MSEALNPGSAEYRLQKSRELLGFFQDRLTIEGAQLRLDEETLTIHVQTPPITQNSALFTLDGERDLRRLYEICHEIGELNTNIQIPSIGRGATYATFNFGTVNLKMYEDEHLLQLLMDIGEAYGPKGTKIGHG